MVGWHQEKQKFSFSLQKIIFPQHPDQIVYLRNIKSETLGPYNLSIWDTEK